MLLAGYCGTCNAPDTRTVVLVSLASLLRAPESEEKFEPEHQLRQGSCTGTARGTHQGFCRPLKVVNGGPDATAHHAGGIHYASLHRCIA